MQDVHWDVAHAIAEELVASRTDINELAAASAYLHQSGDPDAFFRWLDWMEVRSEELARSKQTPVYYHNIKRSCQRLREITAETPEDTAQQMGETLAWAVRLMRYYPHAAEPASVDDLPEPEVALPPELPAEMEPEFAEAVASLDELRPGMALQGTVRRVVNFGAFVDIGVGADGLVHISELREGFVRRVEDVVSKGETVTVWVKDVDRQRNRIGLTMKGKPPLRLADLEPGMVLEGTVKNIKPYGAFVDIGAETDGLVHISEMAVGFVTDPHTIVSVGDKIEVLVLAVDQQGRRVSLSMKAVN